MHNKYAVSAPSGWVGTPQGPQLVRWGSVFCGTICAIALFALLDALWLALSFASNVSFVYSNLSWWIGGTAIFCMFVAGLFAGFSAGARGAGAGMMGGLTTWALVVLGVGAVVLPTFGIGHVPNTVTVQHHVYSINYLTYWTTFWSLLIGLGVSVAGGMIGGSAQRRADEPYLDLQRTVPAAPVTVTSPATAVSPATVVSPAAVVAAPATTTEAGPVIVSR